MNKFFIIIFILFILFIHISPQITCGIEDENKIDCAPEGPQIENLAELEALCYERDCCYHKIEAPSIPWCYYKSTVPTTIITTIPTTIITTIPTTIITTIPTTIPTTIITTIPTTIITIFSTTIFTSIPTPIIITLPFTNRNNINSTIIKPESFMEVSNILNRDYLNNICKLEYNEMNSTLINECIQDIKKQITEKKIPDEIYDIIQEEKKDLFLKSNNSLIQLSSSYNQNNLIYENISTILLSDCEISLKKEYNISENETLFILKIEQYTEGLLFPIISYEVFHPITKELLDLNSCNNTKINLLIPVKIDENKLIKYNLSSEYYNDKCHPASTEKSTDIILEDRIKEYYNNNLSLCESNCEYTEYNINTKKALCECNVKTKFDFLSEIKVDKNKLLDKFKNLNKALNLEVIKCYYILFTKNGFTKNIGNYIILLIILYYLFSVIYFSVKGYKSFMNKIEKIIKRQNKIENESRNNINDLIIDEKINNNNNKKAPQKKKKKKKKSSKSKLVEINKNSAIKISSKDIINNNSSNNLNNNVMNYPQYDDYEINNLPYEEALIIDKRTYVQYYISLLKTNHLLVFTFINWDDYNTNIIKICLFFFTFSLFFTINALFFNDSSMHKIYEEEGKYNFIYQLPQILYSAIISTLVNYFIKFLSLSEKKIVEIRKQKKLKEFDDKEENILKSIKLKFLLFFIFSLLFLLFFWYYISCFCAVYYNTQFALIKDTIISFILPFLYQLAIYLVPGIIRIPSLKESYNKGKYKYNFSKILQFL